MARSQSHGPISVARTMKEGGIEAVDALEPQPSARSRMDAATILRDEGLDDLAAHLSRKPGRPRGVPRRRLYQTCARHGSALLRALHLGGLVEPGQKVEVVREEGQIVIRPVEASHGA